MEWYVALIIIGGIFLLLLGLGVPVAATMGLVAAVYIIIIQGPQIGLEAIALQAQKALANDSMMPMVMYVLLGEIMLGAGLADDMFEFASKWLGWVPGGLAVVAIGCGTIFATCSGSSAAAAAVIGKLSIPQMLERKYSKYLAMGSVAAAGGLACLIPPSILMVVYASFCDVSVGRMLMAGVVPGLILSGTYVVICMIWALSRPNAAPREPAASWTERLAVLKKLIGPAFIVFAVLGTIMLGIATVNESAVMGVVMTFILAVLRRRATSHGLMEALQESIIVTTLIVFIVVGAKMFSWTLNYFVIPQHIVEWVAGLHISTIQLMIMFQLLYFVLGLALDTLGQMYMTMPIILPILDALGLSPIWFGIMFLINAEMGMITPPFGPILFILMGIAPKGVGFREIVWGSVPFFIGQFSVILLVMVFPPIALWFPELIFG